MKTYRYYCLYRPPMMGAIPKEGIINIKSFDEKIYTRRVDRAVWGYVEYDRKLTDEEIADYELLEV